MHGAYKAKMTEELKNFLKVFFLPYSLSKKIEHNFLKRQVKFVYTNIYTSPTHKRSTSDDHSIPSLRPTYCPSSLGYSARILFTTQEGITILTPLPNPARTNQQSCQ